MRRRCTASAADGRGPGGGRSSRSRSVASVGRRPGRRARTRGSCGRPNRSARWPARRIPARSKRARASAMPAHAVASSAAVNLCRWAGGSSRPDAAVDDLREAATGEGDAGVPQAIASAATMPNGSFHTGVTSATRAVPDEIGQLAACQVADVVHLVGPAGGRSSRRSSRRRSRVRRSSGPARRHGEVDRQVRCLLRRDPPRPDGRRGPRVRVARSRCPPRSGPPAGREQRTPEPGGGSADGDEVIARSPAGPRTRSAQGNCGVCRVVTSGQGRVWPLHGKRMQRIVVHDIERAEQPSMQLGPSTR